MADWAIKILGEDPKDLKPSFELNFTPYLKLVTIGEKRAADSYGFKFGAGLPATVLAPRLIFEYVSILDPFPTELDKFDPIRFEPSTIAADRSGNLTSYGLGFMFMQETTFHLGLEAISSSLKHKDELVNYDDFSGLDVRLFGENRLQPWLVGILNLGYGNRSFPDSPDTRKDTFTLGGLTLRYFITPNFYNDLRINYKDQKSNREYSVYKRYEAGLYLTLEL